MNPPYLSIHDIRFMRYQQLREWFRCQPQERTLPVRGGLKRFCEFGRLSAPYMSHVDTRRKQIGERTARKLEAACEIPPYWMDGIGNSIGRGAEDVVVAAQLREAARRCHLRREAHRLSVEICRSFSLGRATPKG